MAIKVNLVPREGRAQRSGAAISLPRPSLSGLRLNQQVPIIGFVVVLLAVGGFWYSAYREKADHEATIKQLKAQDEALKRQLTELRLAEAAKKEIQRRIAIIGRVAKSQEVPVAIMNGIYKAVPQGIWLTGFDMKPQEVKVQVEQTRVPISYSSETLKKLESKKEEAGSPPAAQPTGPKKEVTELAGYSLVIKGMAFTNFQVADFMENLRKLGLFSDVDFTATQAGTIEQVRVVTFEVTAAVKL